MIVDADNPLALPRNCPNAGTKSPLDSPCRYSSGSTSAIFAVLRAHAGRIAEENRCRSPVSGSTRLSLTRGARHFHRASAGEHVARPMAAVAHHQPMPLRPNIGEPGDLRVDLRLRGLGQHPPRPFAHELVKHRRRSSRTIAVSRIRNYSEHRLVPSRPAFAAPLLAWNLPSVTREGTPLPKPIHRFQALLCGVEHRILIVSAAMTADHSLK